MGLYSGGLIIERIFASEIWGAYFREGFFFFYYLFHFIFLGGGAYYPNFSLITQHFIQYNAKIKLQKHLEKENMRLAL